MSIRTAPKLDLPRRSGDKRSRWQVWVLGAMLSAAALMALLSHDGALDTFLWRGTRWMLGSQDSYVWENYRVEGPGAPWYQSAEPPFDAKLYKRTEQLWRLFRDLGEPWTTVLILALVALYDRRRWRGVVVVLTATISTGIIAVLIRMTAGRLRPDGLLPSGIRNQGGNHWELFRGFWNGSDLSFPSGHATLAFATAAALTYLSPRGRWLFYGLAAGCALSRVVMQAHFYSDVLAGALIGGVAGHLSARWVGRRFNAECEMTNDE